MKAEIHTVGITHKVLIIAKTLQEELLLGDFERQEGTLTVELRQPPHHTFQHLEIKKEL